MIDHLSWPLPLSVTIPTPIIIYIHSSQVHLKYQTKGVKHTDTGYYRISGRSLEMGAPYFRTIHLIIILSICTCPLNRYFDTVDTCILSTMDNEQPSKQASAAPTLKQPAKLKYDTNYLNLKYTYKGKHSSRINTAM